MDSDIQRCAGLSKGILTKDGHQPQVQKLCVIFSLYRNIRCCEVKITPAEGAEKGDISGEVKLLVDYLQNMEVKFIVKLQS